MSLRNALQSAVARCTPLQMQHATFEENHATSLATVTQLKPANLYEIRLSGATGYATSVQLGAATDATRSDFDEKLHVAFAGTCNTQPGALTAHRLTADLLKAAMRACEHWHDSPADRDLMHLECLATPAHLQADLLAHFKRTYPESNI